MNNYEAKQEVRYAERKLCTRLSAAHFAEAVRLVEKYAMDPTEAIEASEGEEL